MKELTILQFRYVVEFRANLYHTLSQDKFANITNDELTMWINEGKQLDSQYFG